MAAGVIPAPSQIADIRNRSTSKQAQQPLLRFRIRPRGVRLLVGQAGPRLRASSTEEKKGKLDSTKGAQLFCGGRAAAAFGTNDPIERSSSGIGAMLRSEKRRFRNGQIGLLQSQNPLRQD